MLIVTQAAAIPRALVRMLWQLQPEDAAQARLAALLLRAPSYRASTAAPAQHTQQERFSLLCSAFKPLAELASGSDAQMNTLLVNVSELSAAQRRGIVVGNGAGGRGAGGRGAGVAAGRGMAGRGAVGHGAVGRDAGHAGAGAASRARCCTVCKQPGHNRTTCRSSLRDLGVVGDDEPLVLPHAPALPSDSDNDALPSAPPLEPSIAPPAAPPSAPQPTPQPAPQPQSAPTRAGGGGGATVTINVGTLTSLVGHGGSFSLDDLVGAGGVELPHAPAPVANPQVLRGKGRPKVVRYKSSRELKKRKRNAS